MPAKGFDLLPEQPVRIRVGDRNLTLKFSGARTWALLEEHFGGPLFRKTIPAVLGAIADGSVPDILFITWCGLQHLGEQAPSVEELQQVDLLPLLVGPEGPQDGPLMRAALQALPKRTAPNPPAKENKAATGIGSWQGILSRLFAAVRRRGSGAK